MDQRREIHRFSGRNRPPRLHLTRRVRCPGSRPKRITKPFKFDQLDPIELIFVPYQHSSDNAFVKYSSHYGISRQLPGPA